MVCLTPVMRVPQIVDSGSQFANISDRIIDGFLYVPSFTHGVRSMQAIIQMSRVPGRGGGGFQSSALPPREQLGMHVNAEKFMGFVNGAG